MYMTNKDEYENTTARVSNAKSVRWSGRNYENNR